MSQEANTCNPFRNRLFSVLLLWSETAEVRCCTTLTLQDSHCESVRLDGLQEQANTRRCHAAIIDRPATASIPIRKDVR